MPITRVTSAHYERLLRLADERLAVTVGVHEDDAAQRHPSSDEPGHPEVTVGEVAADNELGIDVPRRSWLRDWVDETDLSKELEGLPVEGLAEEMAARLERSIVKRVESGNIPPPNAPFTIAKKGHGRTLQDTETLLKAIKGRVDRS